MYFKFVVADATMLMKLQKQLSEYNKVESIVPFITCHWEADQKSTNQHKKRCPSWQWQEDGDISQDYTSNIPEMHGEHKDMTDEEKDKHLTEIRKWI